MKQLVLLAFALITTPAVADMGRGTSNTCWTELNGGIAGCHEADVFVATQIPPAPPSPADVTLRNPIAPQSNYTARIIEDDEVFAAQVVLRKNGCYDGRLDGVLADGTVYGLKLFEANMGLPVTGKAAGETAAALRQSHNRFDICR